MLFSRQRAAVVKRREQEEHAAVSRSVRHQRSALLRLFLQRGRHMTPLRVSEGPSGLNRSWQPYLGMIIARKNEWNGTKEFGFEHTEVLPLGGSVVTFRPLGSNWNPPQKVLPYWALHHDNKSLFCLLFAFFVNWEIFFF